MLEPVLLVDDDAAFRKVYGALLREAGVLVSEAADRASARAQLAARKFSLVLLDLMLPPDGSAQAGLQMLEEIVAGSPGTKVVIVSGAGDSGNLLQAVRAGAYDFLTKPVDPDVLLIVVRRALARAALERQIEALQTQLSRERAAPAMVGQSPAFLQAVALAERIARSDLPVLITGENGTGKELLALFLHQESARSRGPFVAVNCGALTETLLESSLFGHVKGAFTGAIKDHRGLFAEADGGTLFLDEIGDMPPPLQVKLLRALETGQIRPVGADKPIEVRIRLLSATNKDLGALQAAGAFREDLYWRIKGAEIRLPPLRERAGDLPLLAQHFLNSCAQLSADGRPKSLSDAAAEALAAHRWPGNLRELKHEMQRATVLAGARSELQPEDLSFTGSERPSAPPSGGQTLQQKIEAIERREIEQALRQHANNRTRAAEQLGLSRQGLLKKMDRYGLS